MELPSPKLPITDVGSHVIYLNDLTILNLSPSIYSEKGFKYCMAHTNIK